jgi:hypothetical protein
MSGSGSFRDPATGVILTPVHIEHTGRNGPETSSVRRQIYRAASQVKASAGTRLMVLKGGRRLHASADATLSDD